MRCFVGIHSSEDTVTRRVQDLMDLDFMDSHHTLSCFSIFKLLKTNRTGLTGHFQGCIVANRLTQIVSGHTHVAAIVRFAPASVHDAQEEQRAGGQQHAVRTRVVAVRLDALPVFVPFHRGGWPALCFTVEGGGFPFGHNEVRGVLNNAGREVFLA